MATTFHKIATVTVGSGGASNIDFTSIPQTYTDLIIFHSMRTSRNAYHESIKLSFNGSTSSQSNRRIYYDGSSYATTTDTLMYGGQASGSTATSNTFGNSTVYIPMYAGSLTKSSIEEGASENSAASSLLDMNSNFWSNTAAITQVTLTPENGGTIQQYSVATLYGIKNS